ncbi:O-antigen ligase family protein [Phenylobacterium sp.]|uniref:O-antigen ligase family protein n=1 Tax=Phenylobacterium sp. TaxID=1871053 RepID=UPI002E3029BE|nr:O-antigen ligase family protein [Phenylobacterium sp.]HEX4709846.1 O-antigen ligase family protein [Phenylobacterium sp.]
MRPALIRQAFLLLTVVILAAPAATPMAGWVRWSFPALSALVAGWLVLRDRPGPYLTLCLWLFVLTPLVRRIVDVHAGYSHANVLMLAPYLGGAWAALAAPQFFLARGRPGQGPMALLFATILYGFVLALAAGRVFPGTLDLLRWSMPPLLACYIIAKTKAWEAICMEIRAWAIFALPLISLYGLYQFVAPPAWDVNWMLNSEMSSIGQPRPFEIRVFSTMNSPASFAYYLEALILLTLSLALRLRWLSVPTGIAALAVSMVRSAWLGLAIGLLLLLARAPLKVRASVLMLAVASVALTPLALTNARVEKAVSDRIETLSNVEHDKSFSERASSYRDSVRELDEHPWGQGIGIANVASNYTESSRVVDGGPIEILLSLGLLFGPLYLGAVALLLLAAIRCRPARAAGDVFGAAVTIATVQAMALSSVTTVVGEIGVLFWLAVGVVLASPRERPRYMGGIAQLTAECPKSST